MTHTLYKWEGHWDPFFSFCRVLALAIAAIVLSSGQSGLTKSRILQIIFAGDLWPTQISIPGKVIGMFKDPV